MTMMVVLSLLQPETYRHVLVDVVFVEQRKSVYTL